MWIRILVAFLVFISSFGSFAHNNDVKKDTVSAVVMYGNDLLLNSITQLDYEGIEKFRDSLVYNGYSGRDIIGQLDLYLSIKNQTVEEVSELVDSLFEEEDVPYALINQIHLYFANNSYAAKEPVNEEFIVNLDTTKFPAEYYYPNWNTTKPNPYSFSLSARDSILKLYMQGVKNEDQYVSPLEKIVITSGFGWREGRPHKGIDLDLEVWDPVVSAFPGVVRIAKVYGGYGRVVVVRHYNGLETLYAHLHRIKVTSGQEVKAGQLLGLGGSSGNSSGSHLHFEVRFKGIPINPAHIMEFKEKQLISDVVYLHKTKFGYTALPEGVDYHTVRKGDFLYKIADQYGTTVKKICDLNGIKRNQTLWVGQKLRII